MPQPIMPCLWFDNQTEQAINLYTALFENSRIHHVQRYPDHPTDEHMIGMEGKIWTAIFELAGQQFQALDGGPMFKFNPAISFFVNCQDEAEARHMWAALSEGGEVLMALDKYPWSALYGWCNDRFGVSWQIDLDYRGQKITPCLSFVDGQFGKAAQALEQYSGLFPNSKTMLVYPYTEGEGAKIGAIQYGVYTLDGQEFIAMDNTFETFPIGERTVAFNEAISFSVSCSTQAEIDRLWVALSAVPEAEACGWCKDRFGVSWQIVPEELSKMTSDPDAAKVGRVVKSFMNMKKLDIAALRAAANG